MVPASIAKSHKTCGSSNCVKAYRKRRFANELNPRWKGGTKIARAKAMANSDYQDWRNAVFVRDEFHCLRCGDKHGPFNAHHVQSWAENKELRYEVSNGKTLCIPCHKLEHSKYAIQ